MNSLKISEIRTDAGTQIRVRLDDATVAEYAEAYQNGATFPPVIVFHDGSEYILADGFHRVMGANSAGFKDVLADVRKGTRTDALKYALSANSNHGLKRTNADKHNAISVALREFPKQSDTDIGRWCAVDHHTVSKIRKKLEETREIPSHLTRVDRNGVERRLPTTPPPPPIQPTEKKPSIPVPPVVPPPPPITPKPEHVIAVLDGTGLPISQYLLPIWERRHEAQEYLTMISRMKGAFRKAQDEKDVLFAEVNFSSLLAHLDQAYADAKSALPFAVCPTCQGKSADACQLCKGRGFISEHRWKHAVPEETKVIRAKIITKL